MKLAKKINVYVVFDDAEWEEMKRLKGKRTWEQVVKDGLKTGEK